MEQKQILRHIPKVDELLAHNSLVALTAELTGGAVRDAVRDELDALRRAGATFEGETVSRECRPITKAGLYELGLTGTPDSAARRAALLKKLGLPERMTTNAMLEALNILFDWEELEKICSAASAY